MYLNILLVQEQQGQQAGKQDGEIGLWAPLAAQCCYCKFTTSLLSSPLRALFASTHTCPENANSVVSKPAQGQSRAVCFHCSSRSSGTALMISTILLISLQQLPQVPHFALFYSHWAKNPRMLHATQPVEKKQQGSGWEGRRKQTECDQSSTSLLSALLMAGIWTCQRWAWQEGCGETATWCVCNQWSPAWPSSVSENNFLTPGMV